MSSRDAAWGLAASATELGAVAVARVPRASPVTLAPDRSSRTTITSGTSKTEFKLWPCAGIEACCFKKSQKVAPHNLTRLATEPAMCLMTHTYNII